MNKAYLLIVCLLAASFTGCIEEELESATEEETSQEEENNDSLTGNEIVFFVQLNSKNENIIAKTKRLRRKPKDVGKNEKTPAKTK